MGESSQEMSGLEDDAPLDANQLPHHVGVIMDGNGRWAKARGKMRVEGHKRGAEVAREVVRWANDFGVKQISLYVFSTENWNRPKLEVRALMSLLAVLIRRTLPEMMENQVRFRVLGDISALPGSARKAVEFALAETANNTGIQMILCLNYGGQQEILAATKQACAWAINQPDPAQAMAALTLDQFRQMMWCHDIAPLDLLIRTGGEHRISNFHLWDAAYAELYFSDRYWPDFSKDDLRAALLDYANRERRYGKTSEQVAAK